MLLKICCNASINFVVLIKSFIVEYFPQATNSFNYAMKYGSGKDVFINNVWLGHMHNLPVNRINALEYYNKAMEAWDGSFYIHSQYNMTIDKSWVEQRPKKTFISGEKLSWN